MVLTHVDLIEKLLLYNRELPFAECQLTHQPSTVTATTNRLSPSPFRPLSVYIACYDLDPQKCGRTASADICSLMTTTLISPDAALAARAEYRVCTDRPRLDADRLPAGVFLLRGRGDGAVGVNDERKA